MTGFYGYFSSYFVTNIVKHMSLCYKYFSSKRETEKILLMRGNYEERMKNIDRWVD